MLVAVTAGFSLIAAVTTLALGFSVFWRDPKGALNRLFLAVCVAVFYNCLTEFGVRQADSIQEAGRWLLAASPWPFLMACLLHFVLVLTEKNHITNSRLVYLIYLPAVVYTVFSSSTDWFGGTPVREPWGWAYSPPASILVQGLVYGWAIGMGTASVTLCAIYRRTISDRRRKLLAKWVLIWIGIALLAGLVTQTPLTTLLGLHVPGLLNSTFGVTSIVAGIAIWRYRLFSVTPETVGEDVVNTMSDAVILVNPDHTIAFMNPAACRLLGYKSEELTGSPLLTVTGRERRHHHASRTYDPIQYETARTMTDMESTLKTKDGRLVPVSISVSLVRSPSNEARGAVIVARDLTERRQTTEALTRRLRMEEAVAAISSRFIGAGDIDSTINAALADLGRLTGAGRALLFRFQGNGTGIMDATHEWYAEGGEPHLPRLKGLPSSVTPWWTSEITAGRAINIAYPSHVPAEATRDWEYLAQRGVKTALSLPLLMASRVCGYITLNNLPDGAVWGPEDMAILRLTTEIIGSALERDEASAKLQQSFEAEKRASAQLQAEIGKRELFTRAVVHELKTPLTAVLANTELLSSELEDGVRQELARNILKGARTMDGRIDELLDLARGEVGMLQLNRSECDVAGLLQSVKQEMDAAAVARKLKLELDVATSLPLAFADQVRIRQVVLNLIANAFKFTPRGGTVNIYARPDGAGLVVTVQDNGVGIAPADQELIFQPYFRRLRSADSRGGLGLGLALSRMLVELHGGRLWLASETGRGSAFSFTLPVRPA